MRNKIVNYIFRFGKYVGNVKIILRCKRRIIRNFLCLILLSVVFCGHSAAGVWRDSFDDEELKDWQTDLGRRCLGNRLGSGRRIPFWQTGWT